MINKMCCSIASSSHSLLANVNANVCLRNRIPSRCALGRGQGYLAGSSRVITGKTRRTQLGGHPPSCRPGVLQAASSHKAKRWGDCRDCCCRFSFSPALFSQPPSPSTSPLIRNTETTGEVQLVRARNKI